MRQKTSIFPNAVLRYSVVLVGLGAALMMIGVATPAAWGQSTPAICVPACSGDSYCDTSGGVPGVCRCRWGNFEVGFDVGAGVSPTPPRVGDSICNFVAGLGSGGAAGGVGQLINAIVVVLTALVVISAVIGVTIGGYFYMTAGGNADRIRTAKLWIGAAILGTFLALAAYAILFLVSPTLV